MTFPVSLQKSWHGKRFNSYNRVLKDIFGARVYKIGMRMDFTCPNRDGKVAVGGCIYCNNASHTSEDYPPRDPYFWLERGLESVHDRTLQWVNRGHGLREFIDAVDRAKRRRLRICAH